MEAPQHMHRTLARGIVRIDTERRRMWVRNQRLHHGLTGVMLATAGLALMAHDWHDRSAWFERGPQSDGPQSD